MATTYAIFERAERIEALSAEGYRLLAEQFPEGRELFLQLEHEELQHAARVRLLAARYRHDPRLVERAPSELAELDVILSDCEVLMDAIRTRSFARSFEEACTNLAAMEERFARAHAELIARESHPALREFFLQLATQDRGHQALLAATAAGEPEVDG